MSISLNVINRGLNKVWGVGKKSKVISEGGRTTFIWHLRVGHHSDSTCWSIVMLVNFETGLLLKSLIVELGPIQYVQEV